MNKKGISKTKASGFRNRGYAAGRSSRSHRFTSRMKGWYESGLLSQWEEKQDRSFFVMIGKSAATNAINENKAMGIGITYLDGNSVITKQPDGKIQVNRRLIKLAHRKYAKGTVLNVATKKSS